MMMAHGEVEPVKCAIFADTGWEPKEVYEWLRWLTEQLPFPVHVVQRGNLRDRIMAASPVNDQGEKPKSRFSSIPYYSVGPDGSTGIGRRQCTNEFKLNPLYKRARQECGLRVGQASHEPVAQMVIGISYDESHRMKDCRERWAVNDYPLVDMRMRRSDCLEWMQTHGYPTPPKSSCIGCPYHSDAYWLRMQQETPDEFEDACIVDDALRANGGAMRGMRAHQYTHVTRKPLRKVVFKGTGQMELDGLERGFGSDCEGMCGV